MATQNGFLKASLSHIRFLNAIALLNPRISNLRNPQIHKLPYASSTLHSRLPLTRGIVVLFCRLLVSILLSPIIPICTEELLLTLRRRGLCFAMALIPLTPSSLLSLLSPSIPLINCLLHNAPIRGPPFDTKSLPVSLRLPPPSPPPPPPPAAAACLSCSSSPLFSSSF